jgi:uracil-DNA glycosylase
MTPAAFVDLCRQGSPGTFNPWFDTCTHDLHPDAAAGRRERLLCHLQCPDPRLLLIGEAAGYQGCRYSGIPFTSERLLLEQAIPRMPDLGGRRLTDRNRPFSEPSASIVWGTLQALGMADRTLLWNVFPWHPHGERDWSNRRPTAAEIRAGLPVLEAFLSLFQGASIVAVGRIATDMLQRLGMDAVPVRHPAYGGAGAFREGLQQLIANARPAA